MKTTNWNIRQNEIRPMPSIYSLTYYSLCASTVKSYGSKTEKRCILTGKLRKALQGGRSMLKVIMCSIVGGMHGGRRREVLFQKRWDISPFPWADAPAQSSRQTPGWSNVPNSLTTWSPTGYFTSALTHCPPFLFELSVSRFFSGPKGDSVHWRSNSLGYFYVQCKVLPLLSSHNNPSNLYKADEKSQFLKFFERAQRRKKWWWNEGAAELVTNGNAT